VEKLALTIFFWAFLCSPSQAFCFQTAGQTYAISPHLIRAIAQAESNLNPSATHHNHNGTVDVGLMQINSVWKDRLGPTWDHLYDPCTNVMVGAWILRQCIDDYGYTWKAAGCYHSRTPEKRDTYAARIAAILQQGETR